MNKEDKVIKLEGQPIFESDRNLEPPYYIYPNDFIAFLFLIGNDFRYSNVLNFLKKLKSQDLFELRTTNSDVYDVEAWLLNNANSRHL